MKLIQKILAGLLPQIILGKTKNFGPPLPKKAGLDEIQKVWNNWSDRFQKNLPELLSDV
jgi:hypothetical protein